MTDLASKTCVPCRGGVPPLKGKELQDLANQVPAWKVVNGHHLTRTFTFSDFKTALAFVNRVGQLAESPAADLEPSEMGTPAAARRHRVLRDSPQFARLPVPAPCTP